MIIHLIATEPGTMHMQIVDIIEIDTRTKGRYVRPKSVYELEAFLKKYPRSSNYTIYIQEKKETV